MIRSWLARRREYQALVTAEATLLIATEGAAGYDTARKIGRLAVERGDREAAKLWARIARRIARRTGLKPARCKIGRPESGC